MIELTPVAWISDSQQLQLRLGDKPGAGWRPLYTAEQLAAAVAAERERCADLQDEAALWEERARHLGWRDEHGA